MVWAGTRTVSATVASQGHRRPSRERRRAGAVLAQALAERDREAQARRLDRDEAVTTRARGSAKILVNDG
jgi:hypothetical protein